MKATARRHTERPAFGRALSTRRFRWRPLACVIDRYIFDPASAAVDTRGDDPGFRRPISRNGLVRLGVHDFSTPSLAGLQHHLPILALCSHY